MSERFTMNQEYMATAKHGTFQSIGENVKILRRFLWNGKSCDFHARTDGAFYLAAGSTGQRLILVAPDSTLDFSAMEAMTANDAFLYIAQVCTSPGIPGWDEFAGWFNNLMRQFGENLLDTLKSISIGALTTTTIPTYSPTGTGAADFFLWVRSALIAAENETGITLQMADAKVDEVSFAVPISMLAEVEEDGEKKEITVQLIVEMRE